MAAMSSEAPGSFDEALRFARKTLSQSRELVGKGLVDVEAEELVRSAYRRVTGKSLSRLELFSRMRDAFPDPAGHDLVIMAFRRVQGVPLQHLTGVQAFLDHEYRVGREVLIPRPETEGLVRIAIGELDRGERPRLGLEIGLGSGVISIELLAKFPGLSMLASEVSQEAQEVALANAGRILGEGVSRLGIVRAPAPDQVLEPLEAVLGAKKADFLVSNPPYLARTGEAEQEVVAFEPEVALFAPADDLLYFYRKIAERAASVLRPEGKVFVELASERAAGIAKLFSGAGWETSVHADLNGRPRVLVAARRS